MVGNGICHQPDAAFPGYLFHDLGFPHAWGPNQENRPLPDGRDYIFPVFIL